MTGHANRSRDPSSLLTQCSTTLITLPTSSKGEQGRFTLLNDKRGVPFSCLNYRSRFVLPTATCIRSKAHQNPHVELGEAEQKAAHAHRKQGLLRQSIICKSSTDMADTTATLL